MNNLTCLDTAVSSSHPLTTQIRAESAEVMLQVYFSPFAFILFYQKKEEENQFIIGQWCREGAAGRITDIYQDELWLEWTRTKRALQKYSGRGEGGRGVRG